MSMIETLSDVNNTFLSRREITCTFRGLGGKLKKLEVELEENEFAKLLMALRLSLILCHARKDPEYQALTVQCDEHKQRITLTAPESWVNDYPQSTHLLKLEMASWQKAPWLFEFVTNR